jgi:N-acetylneuraminic acid mutarotase
VDLANPDDNFSEGPTVKFVVPAAVPTRRPFPWWIVAAVVGVLILVGAGTYGIVQLTHKAPSIAKPTTTVPVTQWKIVASIPTARSGLAAVLGPDGHIYAIGGFANNRYLGNVEAYDPNTNTWLKLAAMPTGRNSLAAVTGPDHLIYAIGGKNNPGEGSRSLSIVEAYDPATNTWADVATMSYRRRGLAAVLGPDDRIYAIGGYTSDPGFLNTVESYTPGAPNWTPVTPMPTTLSNLAAVTGLDGRIYVFGVSNSTGHTVTEVYSVSTGQWVLVAPMPTVRGAFTAALGADGHIYVIGGQTLGYGGQTFGQALKTVEAYNPVTDKWTTIASLPAASIELGAATGSDGRIYAIGGSNSNGDLNSVAVYSTSRVGSNGEQDIALRLQSEQSGLFVFAGLISVIWHRSGGSTRSLEILRAREQNSYAIAYKLPALLNLRANIGIIYLSHLLHRFLAKWWQ